MRLFWGLTFASVLFVGVIIAICSYDGGTHQVWIVDDPACLEKCALAAAASRDFHWNKNECVRTLCKNHMETRTVK